MTEREIDLKEPILVDDLVPGSSSTIPGGSTIPGAATVPGSIMAEQPLPGLTPAGMTQVSAEAQAASRAKYIQGLDAYNQDDFERARQDWIMAKQLDPGNMDAELGLRRIEERMMIK